MSAQVKPGFTLIELIVSISIILLLVSSSLAVFSVFRSKRSAINDSQLVANTLRDGHRRSLSGLKPDGCVNVSLSGYTVTVVSSSLQLVATCPGGTPVQETVNLPSGKITAGSGAYFFPAVSGGATSGSIDVCTQNNLFRVTITTAGSISDPVEVVGGC